MKTKGYIFSIIILTLLLVGIAYVRALKSNQSEVSTQVQHTENVGEVAEQRTTDDYIKRDELGGLIDSVRLYYIDSLYTALSKSDSSSESSSGDINTDSIIAANGELSGLIAELRREVAQVKSNNGDEFKKLVYRFYAGEISDLPADFTKYEKKVSVSEIKAKTNKYFNLKAGALDRIIKSYK